MLLIIICFDSRFRQDGGFMKKLGIIILNYNDEQNTIRLCREYEKVNIVDKIIVVDNKSSNNDDKTFKDLVKLKSKKVDVIQTESNRGYAAGNNFGINYLEENYGSFEYIAISNPDIYIESSSIDACVNYLDKNDNVAICAPRMLNRDNVAHPLSGWQLRTVDGDIHDSSLILTRFFGKPHIEMYDKDYMEQDEINVDCIAGSFFIIRNEIFKKIGYFDEKTFLYYEEDILGNKIKKLGYRNVILNKYTFTHLESVSVDRSMKFMKKFKNLQRSKIYYHKIYNENSNFFKIFLLYFFTYFRYIEIFLYSEGMSKVIRFFGKSALYIYKFIILMLVVLSLPFTFLWRIVRPKKKILYYSLVNWKWIKQRPHFVPLYLCDNGYKVDYMYDDFYDKYIHNQGNVFVNNDTNHSNLKIKCFRSYPYYVLKSKFNRFIFATRTLFFNYDKVIFTNPKQITNLFITVLKLRGTKIYYECMDNYVYWEPEATVHLFNWCEEWLCKKASKVIVSSLGLKKMLMKKHNCDSSKLVLIRNGYDKEVFENYCESPLDLKHPNAVYIGTIDEWFDFDSIMSYAKDNKDKTFYIIGPVVATIRDLVKEISVDNIVFTGPIEHKYVPGTIEKSDVMLLPFIINDLIEDVDPVKVYEYLYLRKPVVSSYWKELDQFKEFTIFYKNSKEFSKMMDKAFKTKISENNNYKKLMFESTWDERLKKYLDAIK